MNALHLYAPGADVVRAITDYNCPRRRPGGRCGSYHAIASFLDWYGWYFKCCNCGATVCEAWSFPLCGDRFEVERELQQIRAHFQEIVDAGGQIGDFQDPQEEKQS